MMKALFSQTIQKGLFFLVAILTFTHVAISQSEMPAHNPVALKAIEQDMNTHVPVPDGFVAGAERSVVINVDYNGFTASAQSAFQYAVDIWASQLTSTVPIEIEATWEDIPGNTLGYAGASSFYINFSGAPESDTYYPLALANKHYGGDLSPGNPDIEASFDSGTNWYLGTDGNPPSGQYDFVSVVLHELGHGLGVQGSADVSGSTGYIGLGSDPIIYDHFVENGSGTAITSYTSGTTSLGNQLTGNNLFFNGTATMAANGGNEAKLYAPGSWESGSSYSHLDENTFPAGNSNSLMTPFIGSAESIHSPGAIILGLMADIGWDTEVSGGCTADLMTFEQLDCQDDGNGNILPVFGMTFSITGGCLVQDLCFTVDGGEETCFDMINLGFILGDGDAINLINTTPNGLYELYFTLDDGTVSSTFIWQNGNCSGSTSGCTNPYADNYDSTATTEDGSCVYSETLCDCAGTEHTLGVFVWVGDGYADDSAYEWDGQLVDFNCADWGYDCGDIEGSPSDDPYGVCNGNFPPNNGCAGGGCTADLMTFTQEECQDNGGGLLPTIGMIFNLTGDCIVEDVCFAADGGEFTCLSLTDAGFILGDGEGINLINTIPDGFYEFYFTLDDGAQSGIFTWQNGNCDPGGCTPNNMTFEQLECEDNGDGILPVIGITFGITGDCLVVDICNSVDGGAFTCTNLQDAGFFLGDGDGINFINGVPDALYEFYFTLDDGSQSGMFTWQNGNCDGSGCTADDMSFEQLDCQDDGNGNILPVFGMTFGITGDCLVQNLCFTVDGGEETCFDMINLGFILGDGDAINLINTTPNGLYELYFTLDDGTVSSTFIWQNGNCSGSTSGCTNPYADNYDSTATTEDGSCVYSETLCDCAGTEHTLGVFVWVGDGYADDSAYEWDGQLVDFNCADWGYDCGDIEGSPSDDPYGVCNGNFPPDNGCIDDCSDIEVTLSIDFDCWPEETAWQLMDDMNNVLFEVIPGDYTGLASVNEMMCLPAGCYSVTITDEYGDGMFGSQDTECEIDGYYIMTDEYGNILFEMGADPDFGESITHDFCLEEEDVLGCMDSMACNYNSDATIDDGTCEYQSCLGCTDFEACNYDFTALIDDGSCDYSCYGCTDLFACNYDETATINDGSCEYDCYGCTDFLACNFDNDAIFDDGSCDYSCYGCTDIEACNYDFFAEFEDGSCDYSCYGCTDSTATNYNPDATIDDGSCQYGVIEGCMDSTACNYDEYATVDDGSCDYTSCLGCTDFFACNYDSSATIDDGNCDYSCYGCTDSTATNYDPVATIDDGSCVWGDIFGCMDSGACNYDEFATIDDGSCEYDSCAGCTDSLAENYDSTATIDDGSCIYDCEYPIISYDVFCDTTVTSGFFIEMTIDDLGNGSPYEITNNIDGEVLTLSFTGTIELGPFDNDEVVVITVESTIIPNCLLTSPTLTDNCFVGVDEENDFSFSLYPNPNTGDFIILSENYSGKASLDVYDMTGKLVHAQELSLDNGDEQRIKLASDISSGNYFVSIVSGNKISHIKLLIQK